MARLDMVSSGDSRCAAVVYRTIAALVVLLPVSSIAANTLESGDAMQAVGRRVMDYVSPLAFDSIVVDTVSVSELEERGWSELLYERPTDSAGIERTVITQAQLSSALYSTASGGWYSRLVTVEVYRDVTSRVPLFALTSEEGNPTRDQAVLSFKDLSAALRAETEVDILGVPDSRCSGSIQAVISMPWIMEGLLFADVCAYQLLPATVRGDTTCVWVVSIYGANGYPDWEMGFGIEVVDVRTDLPTISWEGFPEHPENIKVMYEWPAELTRPIEKKE